MAQVDTIPTEHEIIEKTLETFQKRPCFLQIQICQEILKKKKNILLRAATGFGKTLTFFMPLLFVEDGYIIIVTALNILGTQIVQQLSNAQITAVAVSAETYNFNMLEVGFLVFLTSCVQFYTSIGNTAR